MHLRFAQVAAVTCNPKIHDARTLTPGAKPLRTDCPLAGRSDRLMVEKGALRSTHLNVLSHALEHRVSKRRWLEEPRETTRSDACEPRGQRPESDIASLQRATVDTSGSRSRALPAAESHRGKADLPLERSISSRCCYALIYSQEFLKVAPRMAGRPAHMWRCWFSRFISLAAQSTPLSPGVSSFGWCARCCCTGRDIFG
jgi:hypothetical protein